LQKVAGTLMSSPKFLPTMTFSSFRRFILTKLPRWSFPGIFKRTVPLSQKNAVFYPQRSRFTKATVPDIRTALGEAAPGTCPPARSFFKIPCTSKVFFHNLQVLSLSGT
jgi:hypothetical protein